LYVISTWAPEPGSKAEHFITTLVYPHVFRERFRASD
jgi:hypothetical protein